MSSSFRVVAIVSAFNEEDVVEQVVVDLIQQGVMVYFLDDGCTDGSVSAVNRHIGRGVLGVEKLPATPNHEFNWINILTRKEELARDLEADWFINHDADEFREAPWQDMSLADAIERVDREGYNAIDFALLDFWPTHESFAPGDDVRKAFPCYAPSADWNQLQVKCWKKHAERVDLKGSGGHDVNFPGRRVHPRRFILRHYPIRSSEHGRRKVFAERLPRYLAEERERGWHVQYDRDRHESTFVREPSTLKRYDPVAVRADLADEDIRRGQKARDQAMRERDSLRGEIDSLRGEIGRLQGYLARQTAATETLSVNRALLERHVHHLDNELRAVYASKTWRWAAPIRALFSRWLRV